MHMNINVAQEDNLPNNNHWIKLCAKFEVLIKINQHKKNNDSINLLYQSIGDATS